jgi:hypothetical protein
LSWIRTSECIFRNFWRIWIRKTSINTFRSFCTAIKLEYWEVKKSHGGRRESLDLLAHFLQKLGRKNQGPSNWTFWFCPFGLYKREFFLSSCYFSRPLFFQFYLSCCCLSSEFSSHFT